MHDERHPPDTLGPEEMRAQVHAVVDALDDAA